MERKEGDDDLTDDVTVSQGQMLQNDDSQQNMNLRQSPNPNRNRNRNQNQGQQQALYPPFENMHLNPNRNNFNEPQRPPPRYQLNAERVISSNYLPSYQNQYMRRPPSQPSTNVNVASNSGGVTGQGRPNLDPGDPMASHAEYSYNYSTQPVVFNPNYFSIPPERLNINPGHLMANHALASNTLSILQARPNSNLGHLMANPALGSNTPWSSESQEEFVMIPHHSASQSRSQGVFVHQGVPDTPSVPASRPITSLGASQMRNQVVPGTSSVPPSLDLQEEFVVVPHHSASPTRSPGVSLHQGVPDTQNVPASRTITSLGASQIRNQVVPATSSVPPSSDLQEEFVVVPHHSASPTRSPGVSVHQGYTQSVPASRAITSTSQIRSQGVSLATPSVPSHTASISQIRNRGAPVVPVRPGYSSPRGTSQQVRLPVHESNLSRNDQVRARMRARHPEADKGQLDILVERAVEEIMISRRQVDRHAYMRLDTDHMSHEELVELEERMGYINTGVSEEIVNERMIRRTFSAVSEKGSETCCICLKEYVEGDQIESLDCGHKFHSECIKNWLAQKNTCPICEKVWHWSHWSQRE